MTTKRIWIVDGHNMIFAIPPLHQLQVSDRGEEARRGLTDKLEMFALERGQKVLIVFDGNDLPSNPYAIRRPLLETVYTRRGEEVADDRIIHEASSLLKQGCSVTVVTDDVSTLAAKLPRGVQHLGVKPFWMKHIERGDVEGGKRVEGDFSDLEREMLARAAMAEAATSRAGQQEAVPPGAGTDGRLSMEEERREGLRRKRERGRLRQKRRLERLRNRGRQG